MPTSASPYTGRGVAVMFYDLEHHVIRRGTINLTQWAEGTCSINGTDGIWYIGIGWSRIALDNRCAKATAQEKG